MFSQCSSLTTAPELPATTLSRGCYNNLFRDCTNLSAAPELPATTLAEFCYSLMFQNCIALTSATELPASTLAGNCYRDMFKGCTSLTEAPDLPATILGIECYYGMFQGCTSLTEAPELPATTLRGQCYQYMFAGCSSLTTAPELPATTLKQGCYGYMFQGCTSLTTAPELPASAMVRECYQGMFQNDSSLSEIKIGYTGNFGDAPLTSFQNWVDGVAASGTFYYDGEDTTTGNSAIPTGWTVKTSESPYLQFTSLQNGSTWSIGNSNLEYSTNGGYSWTTYSSSTTVTMDEGDEMYIRAITPQSSVGSTFSMTGSIAAEGPIESLLSPTPYKVSALDHSAVYQLFSRCSSLKTPPTLTAAIANYDAFTSLFNYCS